MTDSKIHGICAVGARDGRPYEMSTDPAADPSSDASVWPVEAIHPFTSVALADHTGGDLSRSIECVRVDGVVQVAELDGRRNRRPDIGVPGRDRRDRGGGHGGHGDQRDGAGVEHLAKARLISPADAATDRPPAACPRRHRPPRRSRCWPVGAHRSRQRRWRPSRTWCAHVGERPGWSDASPSTRAASTRSSLDSSIPSQTARAMVRLAYAAMVTWQCIMRPPPLAPAALPRTAARRVRSQRTTAAASEHRPQGWRSGACQ